jgi:hypothetical protein
LAAHEVWLDSQPLQIGLDRVGVFRLRTLEISIVEAQNERSIAALGEQPVEQRGAGVADMDDPVGEGANRTTGGRAISPS